MALWTPANLAVKPLLWIDPSDAGAITLGGSGRVSQVLDRSGNGRHATQSNDTYRPSPITLNGLTALDLRTARYLNLPAAGVSGGKDRHLFCVADQYNSDPGPTALFSQNAGNTGGNGQRFTVRRENAGAVTNVIRVEVAGNGYTTDALLDSASHVFETYLPVAASPKLSDFRAATDGVYSTNALSGTDLAINTIDSGNVIGLRLLTIDVGNNAGFVMAELLYFGYRLATADAEKVQGYLAHKWGTADKLPAAHPYKSAPPQVASTPLSAAPLVVGSRVGTPSLRVVARLSAPALSVASTVGAAAIRVATRLAAAALEATPRLSRPELRVSTRLSASEVASQATVSRPTLTLGGALKALALVSGAQVSAPTLRTRTTLAAAEAVSATAVSRPSLRALARLTAVALTVRSFLSLATLGGRQVEATVTIISRVEAPPAIISKVDGPFVLISKA